MKNSAAKNTDALHVVLRFDLKNPGVMYKLNARERLAQNQLESYLCNIELCGKEEPEKICIASDIYWPLHKKVFEKYLKQEGETVEVKLMYDGIPLYTQE